MELGEGNSSTSVTQSITTPITSSASSRIWSAASESNGDATTSGAPNPIAKEENVLTKQPQQACQPPIPDHQVPQPTSTTTTAPKSKKGQSQDPASKLTNLNMPEKDNVLTKQPQKACQPPLPDHQVPQLQQPQTPKEHQGAPQTAAPPVTTARVAIASTTTTSTKSNKGQSQEPASKLTNLKLPKKLYKLYELCPHPERRVFLDRLFKLMQERGQPVRTVPQMSRHVLDLFKLYNCVKERGGVKKVSEGKKWKQIAIELAVGDSKQATYILKKKYIHHILAYECLFDRGGIDPQQILAEIGMTSTKKSKDSSSAQKPNGMKKTKRHCAAAYCKSSDTDSNGISFFRFPKDYKSLHK